MEEKKTRGNKKLLVVLAMILLLVAIFALGGYTFARYISSTGQKATQATVAKWGFVVNANADKLFSEQYNKGTAVESSATSKDVKASATGKGIVAPGTTGSMTFGVTGIAEVLAEISVTFDEATTGAGVKDVVLNKDGTATYNPVKWTLKEGGAVLDTTSTPNAAAKKLENVSLSDIKTYFTSFTKNAAAGITIDGYEFELSWAWALDGTETDANKYDTILGYLAYYQNDATLTATSATDGVKLEGGKYAVYKNSGVVTVAELGAGASNADVLYTAEVEISFAVSVSAKQIQNT